MNNKRHRVIQTRQSSRRTETSEATEEAEAAELPALMFNPTMPIIQLGNAASRPTDHIGQQAAAATRNRNYPSRHVRGSRPNTSNNNHNLNQRSVSNKRQQQRKRRTSPRKTVVIIHSNPNYTENKSETNVPISFNHQTVNHLGAAKFDNLQVDLTSIIKFRPSIVCFGRRFNIECEESDSCLTEAEKRQKRRFKRKAHAAMSTHDGHRVKRVKRSVSCGKAKNRKKTITKSGSGTTPSTSSGSSNSSGSSITPVFMRKVKGGGKRLRKMSPTLNTHIRPRKKSSDIITQNESESNRALPSEISDEFEPTGGKVADRSMDTDVRDVELRPPELSKSLLLRAAFNAFDFIEDY